MQRTPEDFMEAARKEHARRQEEKAEKEIRDIAQIMYIKDTNETTRKEECSHTNYSLEREREHYIHCNDCGKRIGYNNGLSRKSTQPIYYITEGEDRTTHPRR